MSSISDFIKKYSAKIDYIDLELIIAHSLNKTREFILTYPEYPVTSNQQLVISKLIKRRSVGEPIAYIVGHKEFYGLNFIVNKNTLIPRPETEQIVELALKEIRDTKYDIRDTFLVDVGTGSGNIIISTAYSMQHTACIKKPIKYFATDISHEALKIAKKNAKLHGVYGKIKFLHGDLLNPFIKAKKLTKLKANKLVIVANLPYLSKEIYQSASATVKKYEPKSALYSPEQGLQHYTKLLNQIKKLLVTDCWLLVTVLLEFSPEQKQSLEKLIRNILPQAKIFFTKDLAGKWRICKITQN